MKMTHKDFNKLAQGVRELTWLHAEDLEHASENVIVFSSEQVIEMLTNFVRESNNRFDEKRFRRTCYEA
jgi:hypothetical protein